MLKTKEDIKNFIEEELTSGSGLYKLDSSSLTTNNHLMFMAIIKTALWDLKEPATFTFEGDDVLISILEFGIVNHDLRDFLENILFKINDIVEHYMESDDLNENVKAVKLIVNTFFDKESYEMSMFFNGKEKIEKMIDAFSVEGIFNPTQDYLLGLENETIDYLEKHPSFNEEMKDLEYMFFNIVELKEDEENSN